ncbi:MAG: hypothetical protein LBC62_10650 [Treponema sp.]|jgi:hypothetical protein|nr:hypothetical protein [Treponema sp.]
MKKFFAVLLILLILGGAVFFLGWAQFKVPPGAYGVMRSKTHGTDPRVLKEGEFRWVWYKLIPTNMEITAYTLEQVSRRLETSGELPSGSVYADLAGFKTDFTWNISGEFSFRLKSEALPRLAEEYHLKDQDGLDALEEDKAGKIESFILQRLKTYGKDEAKMETILLSGSPEGLNREIEEAFPDIENFNCLVRAARYPDYTLYRSVKGLYEDYINRQQIILRDDITREAEARVNSRLRLDELAQYGDLLTRYPVLLEYLALEK